MSTPDLPTASTEADKRESAAWQRGYDYGRGISTPEPGDVKATMRYVEAQPDSGPYRPAMPAHWIIELPDADTAALRAELQGELDQALTDKDMWIMRHNDRVAWAVHEKEEMAAGIVKVAGERNEANARADAAEARLARVRLHIKRIVWPEDLAGADELLALVAADEQAAEPKPSECTCKTVVGGCLAGCTDERVIDPTCPANHAPDQTPASEATPVEAAARAVSEAFTHRTAGRLVSQKDREALGRAALTTGLAGDWLERVLAHTDGHTLNPIAVKCTTCDRYRAQAAAIRAAAAGAGL